MVTQLQAVGVGIVSEKRDFASDRGDKTFYMLYVDFLGSSSSFSVQESDYNAISEGDEVRVNGSPHAAAEGVIKIKQARVQVQGEQVEGGAGQGGGLFGKKKAA